MTAGVRGAGMGEVRVSEGARGKIAAANAEVAKLTAPREQRIASEQAEAAERAELEKKAKLASIETAEKAAASGVRRARSLWRVGEVLGGTEIVGGARDTPGNPLQTWRSPLKERNLG